MRRDRLPAAAAALLLATASLAGVAAAQDETALVYQGDRITLQNGPSQVVEGRTDLAEGTRLTVRFQSTDASNPFFVSAETTVDADGRFAATVDLSDVSPGTNVSVQVRHEGEALAEAPAHVVACSDPCAPTESDDETTVTPTAGFGLTEQVIQVRGGEVAEIPVSLGDEDAATLSVGQDAVNYEVVATVRDGDGDGLVVVRFDTGAAGVGEGTLSTADEGDELTVRDPEPDLGEPIDPADYELSLFRGDAADGDPDDIGSLVVHAPVEATPAPTEAPSTPEPAVTAEPTAALDDATPPSSGGLDLGGVGALVAGGLLAVGAVALLFGAART